MECLPQQVHEEIVPSENLATMSSGDEDIKIKDLVLQNPNISQEETEDSSSQGSISSGSKKIRKINEKRDKYSIIPNHIRLELIDAVINRGEKMKHAALRLGINYSSAKSIFQVYKKEGRADKKSAKKEKFRSISMNHGNASMGFLPINASGYCLQDAYNSLPEQAMLKKIQSVPGMSNRVSSLFSSPRADEQGMNFSPDILKINRGFSSNSTSAFAKYPKTNEMNTFANFVNFSKSPEHPAAKEKGMWGQGLLSNFLNLTMDNNQNLERILNLVSAENLIKTSLLPNLLNYNNVLPFDGKM